MGDPGFSTSSRLRGEAANGIIYDDAAEVVGMPIIFPHVWHGGLFLGGSYEPFRRTKTRHQKIKNAAKKRRKAKRQKGRHKR